jgi:hypothetical protein
MSVRRINDLVLTVPDYLSSQDESSDEEQVLQSESEEEQDCDMFDGLVESVVDFKRDLNTGLLLTELVRLRILMRVLLLKYAYTYTHTRTSTYHDICNCKCTHKSKYN